MYVDPDPECHEEGWGTARSMAISLVAVVAFGGSYLSLYGVDQYLTYTESLGPKGTILQFGVIVGVVVFHELIHAVAYLIGSSLSWDEIDIEVGFDLENPLDPVHHSVHPARPIRRWPYSLGLAAPGLTLGIVPAMVGLVTGNSLAMFAGLVGIVLISTDVGALIGVWRYPETSEVSGSPS